MAKIRLNPNVANFIVQMDWRDAQGDEQGFSDELVRRYEAGDLIILKNAPLRFDYALLNRVSLPEGRRFQKLSDRFIAYPKLYKPDVARFMLQTFASRPLLYARFRGEVRRVSNDIRRFLGSVFRGYRFGKMGVSWRFTRTGPESLHVDYFAPKSDVDYLRLFVNIDEEPRIWTVSHQLEELIRRNYRRVNLAALRDAPAHEICLHVTRQVLMPLTLLPPEETDRHVIEFEQGDVWLCESRINSHQIYAGRRMIATDFYVDPLSLRDPSQRLEARVRRTMQECEQAMAAA